MNWNIILWLVGTAVTIMGPLILIHELGHFILAKLAGVRVEEFGFGFPPRMVKLWRGKGYLKIGSTRVEVPSCQELPSELEVNSLVDAITQRRDDGSYVLRRLEVLDDTADVKPRRKIVEEGVNMRGVLTALEPGTIYSLNWLPMGAFVKMTGEEDPSDPRSLAAQPKRWRLATLAAGPVLNLIVAVLLLVGAYATGVPTKWHVEIARVEEGTAADEAGLQPGDIITVIDGERIDEGLLEMRDIIRAAPDDALQFTVLRGGEKITLKATPRLSSDGYGFLGILMSPWPDRQGIERYSIPRAFSIGFQTLAMATRRTLELPLLLIQGGSSAQEVRPGSVIAISQMMALAVLQSLEWNLLFPSLQTASLISLALGLTNLLPLPALDGGRILFVLIEAVRGRRIPPQQEAVIHFVGMMILIGLMLVVMLQDIINPFMPWSLLSK
jgi:regulator of sigma E protease